MKKNPPTIEVFDADPDYHRVLIVRVGDERYVPTEMDLEYHRKVFEEAADNKDSKIFVGPNVHVEEIKFGSGGVIVEKD